MLSSLDIKFKKNIISSLVFKFIILILSFLFITLFVNIGGEALYGRYVLYVSLLNLGLLFDAGINVSIVKLAAGRQSNIEYLNKLFSSYIWLAFIFFVIFSIVLLSFSNFIFLKLNLDKVFIFDICVLLFLFFMLLLNSVFSSFLISFEYIHASNKVEGILNFSKIIFALLGFYFFEVAGALLGFSLAVLFANLILYDFIRKKIGLHFTLKTFVVRSFLNKILDYTFFGSGGSIIWRLVSNLDKILISYYLSIEALAYYSIAFSLAVRLWEFSGILSTVSLPRFILIKESFDEQVKLLLQLQVINYLVNGFIFGVFLFYSEDLLTFWLGFQKAILVSPLLEGMLYGVLAGAATYVNTSFLQSHDMHRVVFLNALVSAILYFFIIFLFSKSITLDVFVCGFSLYFIMMSLLNIFSVVFILKKVSNNAT